MPFGIRAVKRTMLLVNCDGIFFPKFLKTNVGYTHKSGD